MCSYTRKHKPTSSRLTGDLWAGERQAACRVYCLPHVNAMSTSGCSASQFCRSVQLACGPAHSYQLSVGTPVALRCPCLHLQVGRGGGVTVGAPGLGYRGFNCSDCVSDA
jgi:hypothetical protein